MMRVLPFTLLFLIPQITVQGVNVQGVTLQGSPTTTPPACLGNGNVQSETFDANPGNSGFDNVMQVNNCTAPSTCDANNTTQTISPWFNNEDLEMLGAVGYAARVGDNPTPSGETLNHAGAFMVTASGLDHTGTETQNLMNVNYFGVEYLCLGLTEVSENVYNINLNYGDNCTDVADGTEEDSMAYSLGDVVVFDVRTVGNTSPTSDLLSYKVWNCGSDGTSCDISSPDMSATDIDMGDFAGGAVRHFYYGGDAAAIDSSFTAYFGVMEWSDSGWICQ